MMPYKKITPEEMREEDRRRLIAMSFDERARLVSQLGEKNFCQMAAELGMGEWAAKHLYRVC